jgi:L-lactate dehydrogenase
VRRENDFAPDFGSALTVDHQKSEAMDNAGRAPRPTAPGHARSAARGRPATPELFSSDDLQQFATALFVAAGLPRERAEIGAVVLVEGDLLDRTTHGLAQLPAYLAALENGSMARNAEIVTISDHGATAVWDGQRNLGPWLVHRGVDLGMERARQYGSFTLAIRRSHHIAALSAYLRRATDRGFFVVLTSSDPSTASVAPTGGTEALITPNPLAAGIPTGSDPIAIDISMSTTTNAMTARHLREGRRLPHAWRLDAAGRPTDDPAVFFAEPRGSILPLGGADQGYKGFSLGLLIEAMTSGLSGFGRADTPEGWGASVFLQVMWPEAFGGAAAFIRQTDHLAATARAGRPASGHDEIRLPGDRSAQRRRDQLLKGVALHPSIMPALDPWAQKLGVALPSPLQATAPAPAN